MVITQEELTDRSVKPVLQEGEALSDARTFPLNNVCCILPSKRYSGTSYLGPLEAWPWVLGGCTYLVGS